LCCVDATPWEITASYTILVFPLSCAIMYVFIEPLRRHAKRMESMGNSAALNSETIRKVIRRNLVLSSVAITSTTFSLGCISGITSSYQSTEPQLVILAVSFGNCDMIVNLVCMCMMTYAWLPPKLRPKPKEEPRISSIDARVSTNVPRLAQVHDQGQLMKDQNSNTEKI
jgi:hypothetical protein